MGHNICLLFLVIISFLSFSFFFCFPQFRITLFTSLYNIIAKSFSYLSHRLATSQTHIRCKLTCLIFFLISTSCFFKALFTF